jgi:hypothetical protein
MSQANHDGSMIELYWLPLGAGGRSVRWNGRVYEAVISHLERRDARALYHSALAIRVPQGQFVVEMTPVPDFNGAQRGVVGEGAVGSRLAGRLRLFRYELRRWRNGVIPDVEEAVDSPVLLSDDADVAQRLLELVAAVPTPVWGRDELGAGEMWNSNSVVAWVITRAGLDIDSINPPSGGRAPGWKAGRVVAARAVSAQAQASSGRRLPTAERRVEMGSFDPGRAAQRRSTLDPDTAASRTPTR